MFLHPFAFRHKQNTFMSSRYNLGPEVSRCLIQIQDHSSDKKQLIQQWDTYNLHTAISKYFIGLGSLQDQVVNYWYSYELDREVFLKAISPYPLIRINQRGFKAVKCPTISGIIFGVL